MVRQAPAAGSPEEGSPAEQWLRRYGVDPKFNFVLPDGRVAEHSPQYCPRGHRIGPNRVLVGGLVGQRTWSCRECDATWFHGGQPRGHGLWEPWSGPGTDEPGAPPAR